MYYLSLIVSAEQCMVLDKFQKAVASSHPETKMVLQLACEIAGYRKDLQLPSFKTKNAPESSQDLKCMLCIKCFSRYDLLYTHLWRRHTEDIKQDVSDCLNANFVANLKL